MKLILTLVLVFCTKLIFAGMEEQKAWAIHNRIAGVPPAPGSNAISRMATAMRANPGQVGMSNAAKIAMENPSFYDLVLKNWAKPFTNVEKSKRVSLDDYSATIVGAIRDSDLPGKPFNRVLYEDLVYVGPSSGDENNNFSRTNNNHYENLESSGVSLSDRSRLVERRQSENINTESNITDDTLRDTSNVLVDGVNGAAGIFTTRSSGLAYYDMGTNRRVTRFALVNFMCKDFEDIHDTSLPNTRIRKDVERTPGGDSRTFLTKCIGCHSGQDGLGGAFAYYDFKDGALEFTPGQVQTKMTHLPAYANGYQTVDDSWINYWGEFSVHNKDLGFKPPFSGSGVASLGQAIANSRGFSVCMTKKIFKLMCVRPPLPTDDEFITKMADNLELNNQYNMKNLIADTVAYCVEDKYEN